MGLFTTAHLSPLAPGMAMGILRNAFLGAFIGGGMDYMQGRSFMGPGMLDGAIAGGAGTFALAPSAAGLWGGLAARSPLLVGNAVGGGMGGYATSAASGSGLRQAMAEAAFSAAWGGVLGQGANWIGRLQADDAILAPFVPASRGPYWEFPDDGYKVAPGRRFAKGQVEAIKYENARRNGGVLRSDVSGEPLRWDAKHADSAKIDHILPRSLGGSNSFENARVVSREFNRARGNRWP